MLPALHFEESINTVICCVCKSGVMCNTPNSINNHFRPAPHHLKGDALKAIHAGFQEWPVVLSHKAPYPDLDAQPVSAIPHLKVHRGWSCKHCQASLGVVLSDAKTPLQQVHHIFGSQAERPLLIQDGASAHSKAVRENCFDGVYCMILDWPGNSPDLNPIEHIWDGIRRQIGSQYGYLQGGQVREVWVQIWGEVPLEMINQAMDHLKVVAQRCVAQDGDNRFNG